MTESISWLESIKNVIYKMCLEIIYLVYMWTFSWWGSSYAEALGNEE